MARQRLVAGLYRAPSLRDGSPQTGSPPPVPMHTSEKAPSPRQTSISVPVQAVIGLDRGESGDDDISVQASGAVSGRRVRVVEVAFPTATVFTVDASSDHRRTTTVPAATAATVPRPTSDRTRLR